MLLKIFHFFKREYIKIAQKKALKTIWNSFNGAINESNKLNKDQIEQIQQYWKSLIGSRVDPKWHQLIYSICGVFKPEFVPFDVCMELQNSLSPHGAASPFDNKGLYRSLLKGFNYPIRIAECINGIYYLPELFGNVEVSFNTFLEGLTNIEDSIIKPSVGTDGGVGVASFCSTCGCVDTMPIELFILDFQKKYGLNFCIEKKIHECANLQCLNASSCNTLRVHTFRNRQDCKIEYVSSYVRIGKKGKVTDNANSGGICAPINENGLLRYAITVYPYKEYSKTESGIPLNGYKINDFEKIVATVIKAHSMLPMFDWIGWDVTVDENGNVIIIEFNPNPDVRIEQCIFKDTCLLHKQEIIINQVYGKNKQYQ